jgi:hypothetical protein
VVYNTLMQVQSKVLNDMLRNIPDPALREAYGQIIGGQFPYLVYCMKPANKAHKPGVLIGYITKNNRCIDEQTRNKDDEIVAGIETSRDRFDGRKGFKCYCGNWSIQCEEEALPQSAIPRPPTRDEIFEIHERLMKSDRPQGMDFSAGPMTYDGFKVEKAAL